MPLGKGYCFLLRIFLNNSVRLIDGWKYSLRLKELPKLKVKAGERRTLHNTEVDGTTKV